MTLQSSDARGSSKTQEFDEYMSLDLARQHELGPALELMLQRRLGPGWRAAAEVARRAGRPVPPLFTLPYTVLKRRFLDVARAVGLVRVLGGAQLYQLRHAGASHDFGSGCRTLEAVRKRGRWRSWHSLRRYEKGSRCNQVLLMFSDRERDLAMRSAQSLPAIVSGRLSASPRISRVFLEVFSGSGRLCAAVAKQGLNALL